MPILLVYDTSCSNTAGRLCAWTAPTTGNVIFEIWGGGGGGGGGICDCDCCAANQGGGGGGYALKNVRVTAGQTYMLCAGNPGVGANGSNYGASAQTTGTNGGTSSVIGTNVPANFCATGGLGGHSWSITFSGAFACYAACGCEAQYGSQGSGGQGFNGDTNQRGTNAVNGSSGTDSYSVYTLAGNAGGPGGGAGGFLGSTCCSINPANWTWHASMHGTIPGGGGAGQRVGNQSSLPGASCDCCSSPLSGRGAPGLVKVTF